MLMESRGRCAQPCHHEISRTVPACVGSGSVRLIEEDSWRVMVSSFWPGYCA
jgi:hypothetical protein